MSAGWNSVGGLHDDTWLDIWVFQASATCGLLDLLKPSSTVPSHPPVLTTAVFPFSLEMVVLIKLSKRWNRSWPWHKHLQHISHNVWITCRQTNTKKLHKGKLTEVQLETNICERSPTIKQPRRQVKTHLKTPKLAITKNTHAHTANCNN